MDCKGPHDALVVDQLLFWAAYAPEDAIRNVWPSFRGDRRDFWIDFLRPAYAADCKARGCEVMARLDAAFPFARVYSSLDGEYVRLRMTGVSESQLDDLRRRGWRIGWHTKSHYPLSSLTRKEAADEVAPPPRFRETAFSFPYGEPLSVSALDVGLVEACGYPCAVSNTLNPTPLSGAFFLPRMALSADRTTLHFQLSGFKYFLDNLHRLP